MKENLITFLRKFPIKKSSKSPFKNFFIKAAYLVRIF